MEQQNQRVNEASEVNESLCLNCQAQPYAEGFATKLCAACREKLIRFPIPMWIWIFTGIIFLVMLLGMTRMPAYLSTALHLGKAEKAMDEKRYVTAQNELEKALHRFPDNSECLARLLICCARNYDFDRVSGLLGELEGKKVESNSVYSEAQKVVNEMEYLYDIDTTLSRKVVNAADSAQLLLALYDSIADNKSNSSNIGAVMIANNLYDLNKYAEAEKILDAVLANNPTCFPALTLQIAVKRNLKKFDTALAICDKMLEKNNEDITAICQKARVELKRNQDEAASRYALQAMQLRPQNLVVMETQALVDYLAGRKAESMKLLSQIKALETKDDTIISTRLAETLSGKEKYR